MRHSAYLFLLDLLLLLGDAHMNRPAPRHKSTSLVHDVIFLEGIWNFSHQPMQGSESSKAREIGTLPVGTSDYYR
jgi:hypothetical protein